MPLLLVPMHAGIAALNGGVAGGYFAEGRTGYGIAWSCAAFCWVLATAGWAYVARWSR